MKKQVIFHPSYEGDYSQLSNTVKREFDALFQILEKEGFLREPYAKKLSGYSNLFELRVRI